MGNPLCLIQNYRTTVINELKLLKYLDKAPTAKEEKIDNKQKKLTPLQQAQLEAQQAAAQAAAANQKQPPQNAKQPPNNQKQPPQQLKPQATAVIQKETAQVADQDDFADLMKNQKEVKKPKI